MDATNSNLCDMEPLIDTLLKEQSGTETFNRSINGIVDMWYSSPPGAHVMEKIFDLARGKGADVRKMEDIESKIRPAWLIMAARDLVSFISDRETLLECLNVVMDELEATKTFTIPDHTRETLASLTEDMIPTISQGHEPRSDELSQNTTHQMPDSGPPESLAHPARLAIIGKVSSYETEATSYIMQCCHTSLTPLSGFEKAQYRLGKWVLQFSTAKHAKNALQRPVRVGAEYFYIQPYIDPGVAIAKASIPRPSHSIYAVTWSWQNGPPLIDEEQLMNTLAQSFPDRKFSLWRQLRRVAGGTKHFKRVLAFDRPLNAAAFKIDIDVFAPTTGIKEVQPKAFIAIADPTFCVVCLLHHTLTECRWLVRVGDGQDVVA